MADASYTFLKYATAHRDQLKFILKTEITTLSLKSFLEYHDYTDPEEALIQYLGKKELYATTRASLKY
ncbi:unnamed protein product, partial [Auanema sp. JU1783]